MFYAFLVLVAIKIKQKYNDLTTRQFYKTSDIQCDPTQDFKIKEYPYNACAPIMKTPKNNFSFDGPFNLN